MAAISHSQIFSSGLDIIPLHVILPDPVHDPFVFTEIILGIDWIDDLEAQAFFIQYQYLKLIYSSTNHEHATFQVHSPNKEATKRQDLKAIYIRVVRTSVFFRAFRGRNFPP